ncbi:Fungal specific transcription factor domain-containing protein [Pleurostoma richardsiae]|uniref:Fungal specific transcription factor domain-containing protein n=1 Tax=Pleurostoma richardsiae TaxID=41990 RepID=A0AA38RLE2_9PEZI|nr:Fungal specific transcription factor domain-containing protein [Pleurostoma richardsiae]
METVIEGVTAAVHAQRAWKPVKGIPGAFNGRWELLPVLRPANSSPTTGAHSGDGQAAAASTVSSGHNVSLGGSFEDGETFCHVGDDQRTADHSASHNATWNLVDMLVFPSELDELPHMDLNSEGSSLEMAGIQGIQEEDLPIQSSAYGYSLTLSLPPLELQSLLNMYDGELCWTPLTFDIEANPFRCRQTTSSGSRYLLHAILAYTIQHVSHMSDASPEDPLVQQAKAFKSSAVALYNAALEEARATPRVAFLDTTLILCTLELLVSAVGPWRRHISRALQIVESAGGIKAMINSPRLQAQLAMFSWWDCTLALLSRSACVFPAPYYEFIVACDAHDGWNMFSLSGVPRDLFCYLVEIVQLACEKEQTSRMKWASFNMDKVLEVEESILDYYLKDPSPSATDDDEETIQDWHDRRSGVDAWKHALLLYISRVFKWDRKTNTRPTGLLSLSRLTLDSQGQSLTTLIAEGMPQSTAKNGIANADTECFGTPLASWKRFGRRGIIEPAI